MQPVPPLQHTTSPLLVSSDFIRVASAQTKHTGPKLLRKIDNNEDCDNENEHDDANAKHAVCKFAVKSG